MKTTLMAVLVAGTALAMTSGAFAQSSSSGSSSSTGSTGTSSTTTPETSTDLNTTITPSTGSSASSTTGTGTTGSGTSTGTTSTGSTAAQQNPNPNIYGEGRGQGMSQDFASGGSMNCISPAPSSSGTPVPGSFACFPAQHMGQLGYGMGMGRGMWGYGGFGHMGPHMGMGYGGMGYGGMGYGGMMPGQMMGQGYGYGYDQNRYGSDYGYNQYGSGTGQYGNRFDNRGFSQSDPNWYYQNRQQYSRNVNPGYDNYGDQRGNTNYSRNQWPSDRYNNYRGDDFPTGSTSRPRNDSNYGSSYPDYSGSPNN